jgi:hypothetical protein
LLDEAIANEKTSIRNLAVLVIESRHEGGVAD